MARRVLNDEIWSQLQMTMKSKGCHRFKNDRAIMEAILWKLRTGAPWSDVPLEFCPWKTAYNRFNRWAKKGLWEKFFLSYEAKLIRNGCSPTEVMCALTSMRAELGMEKSVLLRRNNKIHIAAELIYTNFFVAYILTNLCLLNRGQIRAS